MPSIEGEKEQHMRKLMLTAALAVVALVLAAAATASASTVTASPGGAITGTSQGNVTFGASGISAINCPVTLNGSLTTSATGTLPITNVGGITGGATGTCNSGSASVLADASTNRWPVTSVSVASGVASVQFVDAKFLVSIPFVGACLYKVTVNGSYSNSTGRLTIGSIVTWTLVQTLSGSCPSNPTLTGTFTITPTQTIALS
jgi:hypothetical protein